MKTRCVNLSSEEVRAALAGRLRLLVRPVQGVEGDSIRLRDGQYFPLPTSERVRDHWRVTPNFCPLDKPGDVLIGRETWRPCGDLDLNTYIQYHADRACKRWDYSRGYWCEEAAGEIGEETPWRSPQTMPAWASRIRLRRVGEARVVRVQGVTPVDAYDAGCLASFVMVATTHFPGFKTQKCTPPLEVFRDHWTARYGKRYPWDSNPWVWLACVEREGEG